MSSRPKSLIGWNQDATPLLPAFSAFATDNVFDLRPYRDMGYSYLILNVRNKGSQPTLTSGTGWAATANGAEDRKILQWRDAITAAAPMRVELNYWSEVYAYASDGNHARGNYGPLSTYAAAARRVFNVIGDVANLDWGLRSMPFEYDYLLMGKYPDIDPGLPYDYIGVDGYSFNASGASATPDSIYGSTVQWAERRGIQPTILETNAKSPDGHAQWILDVGAYAKKVGMAQVVFFDGGSDNFQLLRTDADRAALATLTADPYFGA